jgi:hypothetical protein
MTGHHGAPLPVPDGLDDSDGWHLRISMYRSTAIVICKSSLRRWSLSSGGTIWEDRTRLEKGETATNRQFWRYGRWTLISKSLAFFDLVYSPFLFTARYKWPSFVVRPDNHYRSEAVSPVGKVSNVNLSPVWPDSAGFERNVSLSFDQTRCTISISMLLAV